MLSGTLMQFKKIKSIFNPSNATLRHWCQDNSLPIITKDALTAYTTLCYLIKETFGCDLWERKHPPVRLYRNMEVWIDYVHPTDVSRLMRAMVRLTRIRSNSST